MTRTLLALLISLFTLVVSPPAEAQGGGWETRPYLDPVASYSMYSDPSGRVYSALALGGQAGLHYHQATGKQPYLRGQARVRGEYLIGQASGKEIRVGNFLGPWYKFIGVQTGPDVFWNQYQYGSVTLDPTLGLAWPVTVPIDLKVLYLVGGVSPAWYFSERDAVNWNKEEAFGFGHEFTQMVGVFLDVQVARLSLSYQNRITAYGHQKSIGASIKLGL
jgi:hypothetical protein